MPVTLLVWIPSAILIAALLYLIRYLLAEQKVARKDHQALLERLEQTQLASDEYNRKQNEQYQHMVQERQNLLHQLSTLQQSIYKNTHEQQAHFQALGQKTHHLMRDLNEKTRHQLHENLHRTSHIFKDVHEQLTLIKTTQQRLTDLSDCVSGSVRHLQNLLSDKQSRGVIGEVQLMTLIRNTMPPNSFAFQHTFSSGKRADCVLFLPQPTGLIAIDAKFPLDAYRHMHDEQNSPVERVQYQKQFTQHIRKHIQDIATKYIIPGETAESALMFVPAEAIFADIHAHYPELIRLANQSRVWIVSPTTMMAVLTTAYAVLKDANTREKVSSIQTALVLLAKDFERFQKRMDNVSRHARLLNQDIDDVHKSSQKLTSRFQKIERVELSSPSEDAPPLTQIKPEKEKKKLEKEVEA